MFNERLKVLRKERRLTQKQVFTAINMSERNYQGLEYGDSKPSYEYLIAIANCLDVSIDYLTGRTDNPEVNK